MYYNPYKAAVQNTGALVDGSGLPAVKNMDEHRGQVASIAEKLGLKKDKVSILRDYFVRGAFAESTAAAAATGFVIRNAKGVPIRPAVIDTDWLTAGRLKRGYDQDRLKLERELDEHIINKHFEDPTKGERGDYFYNKRQDVGENAFDRFKLARVLMDETPTEGRAENPLDDQFAIDHLAKHRALLSELEHDEASAEFKHDPNLKGYLDRSKEKLHQLKYNLQFEQLSKMKVLANALEKGLEQYKHDKMNHSDKNRASQIAFRTKLVSLVENSQRAQTEYRENLSGYNKPHPDWEALTPSNLGFYGGKQLRTLLMELRLADIDQILRRPNGKKNFIEWGLRGG